MRTAARVGRLAVRVAVFGAAVVVLTWLLSAVMPHPFSGFLAFAVAGVASIQLAKRHPRQQASRAFRHYLRSRERGADEATARERMLDRLARTPAARARWRRDVTAGWVGPSEKARAIGGIGAALAAAGRPLDPASLSDVYDRARDLFMIAGWDALPPEFVDALFQPLDERDRGDLDHLVARYHLFRQKFFRSASALGRDPGAAVEDFARLLHSLGNRITEAAPGDAERAYRLSLRLRRDTNLAHAGLALLLTRTGRTREAAQEARHAVAALDALAARGASGEAPTTEDITPFRTPTALRQALARVLDTREPPEPS